MAEDVTGIPFWFAKMKKQGTTTQEASVTTGKNAAVSLGITAVTAAATLALGATDIAVSAVVGVFMPGKTLFNAFRRRKEKTQRTSAPIWSGVCYA
jgi:copper oxidase (laccase) domain-containing protein